MNRRELFKGLAAVTAVIPVLAAGEEEKHGRWRWLHEEEPEDGSVVDLWAKFEDGNSHYYFSKTTVDHPAVIGPCWHDPDGLLVLGPDITRWRYCLGGSRAQNLLFRQFEQY